MLVPRTRGEPLVAEEPLGDPERKVKANDPHRITEQLLEQPAALHPGGSLASSRSFIPVASIRYRRPPLGYAAIAMIFRR